MKCIVTQELDAWLKREAKEEAHQEALSDVLFEQLFSDVFGLGHHAVANMLYQFYLGHFSDTELKHRLKEIAVKALKERQIRKAQDDDNYG